MHKIHFLSCVALTLAFVADAAPTSSSSMETQQQLEQLTLDLQLLLKGVRNHENPKRPMMRTFKFYMPRNATELKHLQCLVEELTPLQNVLTFAESKTFPLRKIDDSMKNINALIQELKKPEREVTCDYSDETVNVEEFLDRWVTFCQSIYSTLA